MKRTKEKKTEGSQKKKRKKTALLPLLDNDGFFEVELTVDKEGNPLGTETKRDGRKRQFAHQEGNYPTHIFCVLKPRSSQDFKEVIKKVVGTCNEKLGEIITEKGFTQEESVHISLSRPFALRYHQIQPLVTEVTKRFTSTRKFEVCMPECILLGNDDKSRMFASLRVDKGKSTITSLIKQVDEAISLFGLTPYYEDPIPHASVGWALPAHFDAGSTEGKPRLDNTIGKPITCDFDAEDTICDVEEIRIKSGAYSYSIFLQK